jgi:hypothetical protein
MLAPMLNWAISPVFTDRSVSRVNRPATAPLLAIRALQVAHRKVGTVAQNEVGANRQFA